jgi:hypothetical protein
MRVAWLIVGLMVVALPAFARDIGPAVPKATQRLLEEMLPIGQFRILPDETVVTSVDAHVYPIVITVARAGVGPVQFRLYREGSEEDGTHRFHLDHGSRAFAPPGLRAALLGLLRDKEGAFHWTDDTPTPVALPVPATPTTTDTASGSHAARWLALALVALMTWAVLWKRRADGRGQGS